MRLSLAKGVSRLISVFSPQAAGRYVAGHAHLAELYDSMRDAAQLASPRGGYDAGRRDGPNARWLPADGMADLMIARDAKLIRARARAMCRDNPNMAGALRKVVNNVVFSGIRPQAQLRGSDGLRDKAANDRVEEDWKDWEAATGMWEHEKLAVRHCWQDGGFLVHCYPDEDLYKNGLVPLGVELLDLDAVDDSVNGKLGNGNIAWKGREFDRHGRIRAFYVWRDALFGGIARSGIIFPMGSRSFSAGDTVRLDAENCFLVMERDRIGQTLPVSWLHSCLMTMHDFDSYQEAERIAARLAASFAVFLKHSSTATMGGNDLNGNALTGGQGTDGRKFNMNTFINSGRIDELPPGTEIEIAENKRPGTNYDPFTRTTLRGASNGFGTSYETFSNDFSDTSYSSARQAILEERRGYRMQQHFLVRTMLAPVWNRFVSWRYSFGIGQETGIPVAWQMPGWAWVDPAKDAKAAKDRIALCVDTHTAICSEAGLDFEEVAETLAEEERMLEAVGLKKAASAEGDSVTDGADKAPRAKE